MKLPQLEFVQPARLPFTLDRPEIVVGQAPDCGLRIDAAGVAERHARLIVDAGGQVWLENFEADAFTMHNGMRVMSRQLLSEGDQLEFGLTRAVFRAGATTTGTKAGNADRTMMGSEMPAELRQFLESRKAVVPAGAAAPAPTPAAKSAPQRTVQMDAAQILSDRPVAQNYTVGTPEPEPVANRTVQMAPTQWPPPSETPQAAPRPAGPAPTPQASSSINQPPVQAPPLVNPTAPAAPSKPVPYRAKATMMGVGVFTPPASPAPAPTPAPAKSAPQASTAFMEAPVLPKASDPAPSNKAAPQASTAFMEAPVLPKASDPVPSNKAAPQASTAFMEAPVLPKAAAPAPAPTSSSATTPVSTPIVPITSAASAPQPYTPQLSGPGKPYVPADPGFIGSVRRALGFITQMFAMAKENKTLIRPFYLDLAITTAISIFISVCFLFIPYRLANLWLLIGTAVLYFVDYGCNSLTASLIYDQVTTGRAEMSNATPRVKAALKGIMIFAAVSAVLDLATTYARERHDPLSRILLNILRSIWTTATYVIMPALVIEGVSFKDAFARSKQLMAVDPTAVGSGVVAMSIVSYAVGFVVFPLAYFAMTLGSHIHPILGGVLFYGFINLYWATSGWLKISYSTCFYLWARACAEEKGNDVRLAPAPLRAALEAA